MPPLWLEQSVLLCPPIENMMSLSPRSKFLFLCCVLYLVWPSFLYLLVCKVSSWPCAQGLDILCCPSCMLVFTSLFKKVSWYSHMATCCGRFCCIRGACGLFLICFFCRAIVWCKYTRRVWIHEYTEMCREVQKSSKEALSLSSHNP